MANVLGLDRAAMGRIEILRSNESVSAEGMALLQAFNADAFPGDRRPGNRLSKAVVRLVRAAEAGGGYTKPMLRPAVRQLIEHARRQDVRWVRDTLGLRLGRAADDTPPTPEARAPRLKRRPAAARRHRERRLRSKAPKRRRPPRRQRRTRSPGCATRRSSG